MEFAMLNTVQSALFLILDLYICAKAYKASRKNKKQRYFIWLALLASIQQLMSFFVRMFKTKLVSCGSTIQYAIYMAMFITMALTAWGAMGYLLYLSGLKSKRSLAGRVIMFLPCIVMAVSALASPWTHWLFYLDLSLNYH